MAEESRFFRSILEMKNGAFLEVTDLELTKAVANIRDVNTESTRAGSSLPCKGLEQIRIQEKGRDNP